jgi:hypothetical protein
MARTKLNIPEGIGFDEFQKIRNILNDIMKDLGANQVSMRLNESRRNGGEAGDEDPFFHFSYFVGSVQNQNTAQARERLCIPDPGLFRFGDNVTSKEVREAVRKAVNGNLNDLFAERGWPSQKSVQKKGMGSKGMGRESGLKYQKYIGIKVGGRCVGTLGASFGRRPKNIQAIDNKIIAWAREPSSRAQLISHLRNTFSLWGPSCP